MTAPRDADRLDPSIWKITAVASLGAFLTQLDATVVNVSLSSLAVTLHSSVSTIQWVTSGYLLALALMLPLSGWMVDRIGAKAVYLAACLTYPREPRWRGEGAGARRAAQPVVGPRASRATPQTPPLTIGASGNATLPFMHSPRQPFGTGQISPHSSLSPPHWGPPNSSAPPRLRGNLPRSRPRG
jgi:MFS family permease